MLQVSSFKRSLLEIDIYASQLLLTRCMLRGHTEFEVILSAIPKIAQ
jgi:hypothetical protein